MRMEKIFYWAMLVVCFAIAVVSLITDGLGGLFFIFLSFASTMGFVIIDINARDREMLEKDRKLALLQTSVSDSRGEIESLKSQVSLEKESYDALGEEFESRLVKLAERNEKEKSRAGKYKDVAGEFGMLLIKVMKDVPEEKYPEYSEEMRILTEKIKGIV